LKNGSPPTWKRLIHWSGAAPLGLILCLFVFFFDPIAKVGTHIWSPGDISQNYPLLRVGERSGRPQNELLSDPVTEMEPWMQFNRRELIQGHLPILNPYNGSGVPHLANAQSAALSPFSAPHYLLPKSWAYLLSGMLKLLAAGIFMLLFLRQLGLGDWAALLGSLGYAFCGHNLLLLSYPHVGAAALLPAILYFTERVLRQHEETQTVDRAGLTGLALSYGACALSGQPEPLFFGSLISAVYMTLRIGLRIARAENRKQEWDRVRGLCFGLSAAIGISMLISAIGLLPFIEYMQHSRLAEQRAGVQTPLQFERWPLYAFPDLLGNPSQEYYLAPNVPPINYEAANSGYVGALLLFMALCSLAVPNKSRTHLFFSAVMILWVLWAYDFWYLNAWIAHIPLIGIAPINRSQFVFALAASVCASCFLQHLWNLPDQQRRKACLAILLAGLILVAFFFAGTEHLVERWIGYVRRLPNRTTFPLERMPEAAWGHVQDVQYSFAAGIVGLALIALSARVWIRGIAALIVLTACFTQTGGLLRHYNPLIPLEQHMPTTPLVAQLATELDGETLAIVCDEEALPPSMNMPYGIHLLANYDGLWVGTYDKLYRNRFGTEGNWRTMHKADRQSLQLFGAQYMLTLPGWSPVDTIFPTVPWNDRAIMPDLPSVRPGTDVVQTFTVPHGSMNSIAIWVDLRSEIPQGKWAIRVREMDGFALLAERPITADDLAPDARGFARLQLDFEAIPHAPGKVFRIRIECQQLDKGDGLRVVARQDMPDWAHQALHDATRRNNREDREAPVPSWIDPERVHPDLCKWKLTSNGEEYAGGLALDLRLSPGQFEDRGMIGPYRLLRMPEVQRYRLVTHAIFVSDKDAARRELDHPSFDPMSMVVVEAPDRVGTAPETKTPCTADVIEESIRSVTLQTSCLLPGWVVTNKPYIPGWNAVVDGVEVSPIRVNEAFLAVPVPAGAKRVELHYNPRSVRLGTWLSILGLLLAVLLWRGRSQPAI
jgi:hypothetical protein